MKKPFSLAEKGMAVSGKSRQAGYTPVTMRGLQGQYVLICLFDLSYLSNDRLSIDTVSPDAFPPYFLNLRRNPTPSYVRARKNTGSIPGVRCILHGKRYKSR
jgi:hypothetical protein